MQINLKKPIHFLATGFGAGLLTPAPGTWGTLTGILLAIFLWNLTASTTFFLLLTAVSFWVGCKICQKMSEDLKNHDDGRIVWDEIVAIFFIFAFLPEYHFNVYLFTFLSFRFFDILKPYPIRYFDKKLESGFGIMLDDILAAIYSLILLHLIYF